MSRLKSISSNPTIRNYALDASQKGVKPVAQFLAPTVEVPKMSGYYKKYDAKHRFKAADTRYVTGSPATQLGFTADDEEYKLQAHALDFPMPLLEQMEIEDLMNETMYGTDLVAEAAALAHEMEVIKMALAAAGAGTDLNLSTAPDPVDAVDQAILDVKKAARNSARVAILFGTSAYRGWKNNQKVKDRFNGVQKLLKSPNLEDTSGMLMFNPECELSEMVFDDAAEGLDPDIKWMLDNSILVFARNANPTTMDAGFMKTFRLRNKWLVPDVYQTQDKRSEVLKLDWVCKPIVTNSAAIKRINFTTN